MKLSEIHVLDSSHVFRIQIEQLFVRMKYLYFINDCIYDNALILQEIFRCILPKIILYYVP